MRRDELEVRVLTALQTRFFESAPFQVFCEEFTAAINGTRMEMRATATAANRERTKIDDDIARIIQDWQRQMALVAGARNRHYRLTSQYRLRSTWWPHERRRFSPESSVRRDARSPLPGARRHLLSVIRHATLPRSISPTNP